MNYNIQIDELNNSYINQQYIQVSVYDNQNNYIVPANINVTSTTSCDIDLTGFRTLLGTWNLIITS